MVPFFVKILITPAFPSASNFEEGGIRDWDSPLFYNMDEYLFAMIYRDSQSTNYVVYKDNKIVLDETEHNKK